MQKGDRVKVKDGVKDPDLSGNFTLSGATGTVISVWPKVHLVEVNFDKDCVDALPEKHKKALGETLYVACQLAEDDLELING